MHKLILYIHTIRYLKLIQFYYRIYYSIRNRLKKPKLPLPNGKKSYKYAFLSFIPGIDSSESYDNMSFTFLNQKLALSPLPFFGKWQVEESFSPPLLERGQGVLYNRFEGGQWEEYNMQGEGHYGKLWIYNLYYFDYLLQPSMTRDTGLNLIRDFFLNSGTNSTALEPYPTSLRIINWIKFISRHSIDEPAIIESLHDQCSLLTKNIEYHLLGNHLLENSFALLMAGLFFKNSYFYKKGREILAAQLNEQILADGGHFELSPMYHSIMLNRLLDLINILQNNREVDQNLLPFLKEKASVMICWIKEMTFSSGDIPLFNDAAKKIAPDTEQLIDYAGRLGLDLQKPVGYRLSTSGYRRYSTGHYEMILDVGAVGPGYQPAHTHSDMLSFELYVDKMPFIVDTGTSTYLPGPVRSYERSTSAHNTVTICARDQSEMWGSHRVGRRAKVKILSDNPTECSAVISGFPPLNPTHQRTFRLQDDLIQILDFVRCNRSPDGIAYFHFFPGVKVNIFDDYINTSYGMIHFENHDSLKTYEYNYAPEFNKTIPSIMVSVTFSEQLRTRILLNN